jgi:Arc/MetJ family transcription regulator
MSVPLVGEILRSLDLDSKLPENGSMKTTIDIPEDELRDAMRFTKAKTKREAVVKVLEEFNRRRRMADLVKYAGTFSDGFPTNDEIEASDAARDRKLHGRPR